MSRMLRGQATLQSIIGKSSITKRTGNLQKSLKSASAGNVEAAALAPATEETTPIEEDYQPGEDEVVTALPDGSAQCPICGQALSGGNAHINLHLGEHLCLQHRAKYAGLLFSSILGIYICIFCP